MRQIIFPKYNNMRKIINYTEIREFCYSHGGVKPINPRGTIDEGLWFNRFYCSDKSHSASRTIICSEGQGEKEASMIGILCMHGYVIEFDDKEPYLFCTENELKEMLAQQNFEDDDQTLTRCKYDDGKHLTCSQYNERYQFSHSAILNEAGIQGFVCHETCDNENCPFYSSSNLREWNQIMRKRRNRI